MRRILSGWRLKGVCRTYAMQGVHTSALMGAPMGARPLPAFVGLGKRITEPTTGILGGGISPTQSPECCRCADLPSQGRFLSADMQGARRRRNTGD